VRRVRRILIGLGALFSVAMLAIGGLFAAWMAGIHVPVASGATYLRVAKVQPLATANRASGTPTGVFFVLLVGNDSRPGVGGARGDALHLLAVNPGQKKASMLDIPRDTCWNGDKINAGNTRGPRQQANDVGGLVGVNVNYVVDVDFAGFQSLVDGVGGVNVNVPMEMHDTNSGAFFHPGMNHMNGDAAMRFSRDRHDFPTSDLVRTSNQGGLILDAMRQLQKQSQNAAGEFKLLALLGRHAQLDGIGVSDLYKLGRVAFSLNPNQVKNVVIPVTNGSCLGLSGAAPGLFADFRDDGILQSH
jgi:LCP family protein required for cell wall assembly